MTDFVCRRSIGFMTSKSKKTPGADTGLVSFTVKVPARWLGDMEAIAAREVGTKKSDVLRRALAIGLDELKKRAR